ncbi:unnamed protein product [Protopolystoma xenopodis]|uniref:Uncharacterized protein n=1 Tax=Protopolystoma xenopodis TaxID=117903 RepID=A0A3S5CJZ9_9PLAT|nr:unnamed protein product [Protopolystoma xenopodis]
MLQCHGLNLAKPGWRLDAHKPSSASSFSQSLRFVCPPAIRLVFFLYSSFIFFIFFFRFFLFYLNYYFFFILFHYFVSSLSPFSFHISSFLVSSYSSHYPLILHLLFLPSFLLLNPQFYLLLFIIPSFWLRASFRILRGLPERPMQTYSHSSVLRPRGFHLFGIFSSSICNCRHTLYSSSPPTYPLALPPVNIFPSSLTQQAHPFLPPTHSLTLSIHMSSRLSRRDSTNCCTKHAIASIFALTQETFIGMTAITSPLASISSASVEARRQGVWFAVTESAGPDRLDQCGQRA